MIEDSKYFDDKGYPGCNDYDNRWDGGDTAAIMGNLWALDPITTVKLPPLPWDHNNNLPLRHPDKTKWYGQGDRFSRDQLIAVLCGFAMNDAGWFYREYGYISGLWFRRELFKAHKRRWFLTAWNTKGNGEIDAKKKTPDITGPEVWGLWIRIFKPWWGRLVLWFFDLETLFGSIHWRYFRKGNVCRNHMLVAIVSTTVKPTFVSRLAGWFNNWPELLRRWQSHCIATGEFPTDKYFLKWYYRDKIGLL